MNNAIKAMHSAGVSLADFRKLNVTDRVFLWLKVTAYADKVESLSFAAEDEKFGY